MRKSNVVALAQERLTEGLAEYRQAHSVRWIHPSQKAAAVKLGHLYAHFMAVTERQRRKTEPGPQPTEGEM